MAAKRQNREFELDGEVIADLMLRHGLTVETLAAKAVLAPNTISSVLNGKRPCNQKTGHKIRVALKVENIEDLLKGREQNLVSKARIHEWLLNQPLTRNWVTASNQLQFRIWKLKHEHLNRFARGKCYDLEGMATAERERCRDSLLRHAEVCTRIGKHAHIINNLTTCEAPSRDRWWIIDEWIEGATLGEQLDSPDFSMPEKQKVIRQIADGLNAFHSQNIVRRELSPQTILVRESNSDVVLTEFELAKLLDGSPTVSSSDWPVDPYRAPEATTDEIGRQADIYSWGRIAIELLVGELPPKGAEQARLTKVKLPKRVETMLLKCVSVNWRSRPKNFDAILRVLDSWK
ncbi:MAG: protein kinase [Planctomycetaceae bacterium]|nr:protein kinase [Planctomycetaceae bacterium]MCA9047693.1 protein kinase [Planctomycetaceae bacterium]